MKAKAIRFIVPVVCAAVLATQIPTTQVAMAQDIYGGSSRNNSTVTTVFVVGAVATVAALVLAPGALAGAGVATGAGEVAAAGSGNAPSEQPTPGAPGSGK